MAANRRSKLYTTREAATLFEVSIPTIRRMVADGRLRALRLGRGFRFEERALRETYLALGGEEADWLERIRPQLEFLPAQEQLQLPEM